MEWNQTGLSPQPSSVQRERLASLSLLHFLSPSRFCHFELTPFVIQAHFQMTDLSTFHSVTTFKHISLEQLSIWMNFIAPFKCIWRWIKTLLEMAASLTYPGNVSPVKLHSIHQDLSHSNTLNSATSWQIAMVSFPQRREEVVHLDAPFQFFSQTWNKFCLLL